MIVLNNIKKFDIASNNKETIVRKSFYGVVSENILFNKRVQNLCKLPYVNHPKGCPNWGKREGCPPKSLLIDRVIDIRKTVIAVLVNFDLEKHINKMKYKHPYWTELQLSCLLYWQGHLDKKLRLLCGYIKSKLDVSPNKLLIIYKPEAHGVDVFRLCKDNFDLVLKKNPKRVVWKIALIGCIKK